MEFPSIKLNIFKKLEYFLVLEKLNDQFNAQFKILLGSDTDNNGKLLGTFPTWEVEKKILFWTYAYHKHLGTPLISRIFLNLEEWYRSETIKHYKNYQPKVDEYRKKSVEDIEKEISQIFIDYHEKSQINTVVKPDEIEGKGYDCLSDFFLTQNEIKNAGIEESLRNLVMRGFAEEKDPGSFIISREGLAYGELLWYLYMPEFDRVYSDVFGKCPININRKEEFEIYKLSFNKFAYCITKLQLWSIYGFTLLAGIFISLEVISQAGLIDDLKKLVLIYNSNRIFIIEVLSLPFVLFFVSFVLDNCYNLFLKVYKYKKIEKIREKQ